LVPAGTPDVCKAGASFVAASTAPGEQAAVASLSEQHVLVLHARGVMDITDRVSGQKLFSVGPFSTCKGSYKLVMMPSGQLVLQDRSLRIAWASNSACRGDSSCYQYQLQVRTPLPPNHASNTKAAASKQLPLPHAALACSVHVSAA
jgi:hypothetical protein